MSRGEVRLFIPGKPMGKERPRATKRGSFVKIYTPPKTQAWEAAAVNALRGQFLSTLTGPLTIDILALFPRPKRLVCEHKRKPCSCSPEVLSHLRLEHDCKPDWDNVAKIVCDSLQLANIIEDDSVISVGRVTKCWVGKGEEPGTHIVLRQNASLGYDTWPAEETAQP